MRYRRLWSLQSAGLRPPKESFSRGNDTGRPSYETHHATERFGNKRGFARNSPSRPAAEPYRYFTHPNSSLPGVSATRQTQGLASPSDRLNPTPQDGPVPLGESSAARRGPALAQNVLRMSRRISHRPVFILHPSSFILHPFRPPLWFDALRRAHSAETGKNPGKFGAFPPKERAQFGPFWTQLDPFWTQSAPV
jgi:hypothetical protein